MNPQNGIFSTTLLIAKLQGKIENISLISFPFLNEWVQTVTL